MTTQNVEAQPPTQAPVALDDDRLTGIVKWFDSKKGFGFIVREPLGDEKDVFFHSADCKKSGIDDDLDEGDRVSFVLASTPRGPKAVGLRREQ